MKIIRYECQQCGLVTRVEEGQDYKACACVAEYSVFVEDDAPPAEVPPDAGS